MNKKALVGWMLLIAIVIIIVMGVSVYISFSQTGASLHTGDLKFSVDYEPDSQERGVEERIVEFNNTEEITEEPKNNTALNTSEENNTLAQENISEDDGIQD